MNTLAGNLRMIRDYCFSQASCRECKLDGGFCEKAPDSWTDEDIETIVDTLEEDEKE